jgi:hypothetical protein
MPDKKQDNQAAAAPAASARLQKQFDVALVDPHDPTILHWPRHRVTVDVAELADLAAEETAPRDGESSEARGKRLDFALAEIERERAIFAYSESFGLSHLPPEKRQLRYDVVPAEKSGEPPVLSEAWQSHTHPEKGAPYFRGERYRRHAAEQGARAAAHAKGAGHPEK